MFLAWVGGRVEGLVEGDGRYGGGVDGGWETVAWVLRLDGSVDGGLRRCGNEGLYAVEREVAWVELGQLRVMDVEIALAVFRC